LVKLVTTIGSFTFPDDEAISFFSDSFEALKRLAKRGDSDAMVMIAQGIRYGFVDDDEEPFMLWLEKAKMLGNDEASLILDEIENLEKPLPKTIDRDDDYVEGKKSEPIDPLYLNDSGIWEDPDDTTCDTLGITDLIESQLLEHELIRSCIKPKPPDYDLRLLKLEKRKGAMKWAYQKKNY
jgi:hypothetical protein